MIEVKDLYKTYSGVTTLHGLSFSVKKGEIVGFLGPNGAGKTSTMRILTGYLPPTSGTAKIAGYDVTEDSLSARKHIGYLPENVPLYYDQTVQEYLSYFAQIMRVPRKLRKAEITNVMSKTGLSGVSNKLIGALSRGYKQRVGIAQALVGKPEVLILDEPTVGLDPIQIIEIRELIKDLAKNQTVILSTHILPEVSQICDRVLIINQGRIVADGTVDELVSGDKARSKLQLIVKSDPQKAISLIKTVSQVGKVSTHDDNGEHIIMLECKEDIRGSLLKQLVDKNIDVLEFRSEKIDLESVFLKLVTHEKNN